MADRSADWTLEARGATSALSGPFGLCGLYGRAREGLRVGVWSKYCSRWTVTLTEGAGGAWRLSRLYATLRTKV